jgi:hypothetical protein
VAYDPYQMAASVQRLASERLPMEEFPQTLPNLTRMGSNFYELLKGRNMILYRDSEMRLAVQRAVAIETSRGWRIAKEKASHKIDVVIALAMAALGAVREGQMPSLEVWKKLGEPEPVASEALSAGVEALHAHAAKIGAQLVSDLEARRGRAATFVPRSFMIIGPFGQKIIVPEGDPVWMPLGIADLPALRAYGVRNWDERLRMKAAEAMAKGLVA